MRNTFTKLDIINSSLSLTSNGLVKNLEEKNETLAKALLFYDKEYQSLISLFPWHFLTKRVRMQRQDAPGQKYQYVYTPPADVVYSWKFYKDRQDFDDFGIYYNSKLTIPFLTFPLQNGLILSEEIGEIIDGNIQSNYPELWIFYTHSGKVSHEEYTQQFVTLLINRIEVNLLKSKGADAEKLALTIQKHGSDEDSELRDASIENQRGHRIPSARIIQKLNAYWW